MIQSHTKHREHTDKSLVFMRNDEEHDVYEKVESNAIFNECKHS